MSFNAKKELIFVTFKDKEQNLIYLNDKQNFFEQKW